VTRVKFYHVRDISRVGRRLIKDTSFKMPGRLDHITSKEITFKVNNVTFEDLLSIATGRFTPDLVYKAANEIEIKD